MAADRVSDERRYQQEQAARAIPATERALAAAEQKFGPIDSKTRSYRGTLAGLYQMQGRYAEAAKLLRIEIDALERAEGPRSVNLASSYSRLADVYRKAGRAQEADELLQRALSIYQKSSPKPTASVAARPQAVAAPRRRVRPPPPVMRKQAPRPQEVARPIPPAPKPEPVPAYSGTPARGLPVNGAPPASTFTPPADKQPKVVPPPPPRQFTLRERQYLDLASKLDREAGQLWWERRIIDVEHRYREALRYREAVLGPDDPEVAQSLIRLARLYWGAGREVEASAMHRRALGIMERKLPADSLVLANALWELGGFLQLRGNFKAAEPLMAKALKTFESNAATQSNISRRRAAYTNVLNELGRGLKGAELRR